MLKRKVVFGIDAPTSKAQVGHPKQKAIVVSRQPSILSFIPRNNPPSPSLIQSSCPVLVSMRTDQSHTLGINTKSQKLMSLWGRIELDEPDNKNPFSSDLGQFWGSSCNPRKPGLRWQPGLPPQVSYAQKEQFWKDFKPTILLSSLGLQLSSVVLGKCIEDVLSCHLTTMGKREWERGLISK